MLTFSIILTLMSIAVNNRRDISIVYNRLITLVVVFNLYLMYNIINYLTVGIVLFNGLFYLENYNIVFIYFIFILTILILLITSFYPRKIINNNEEKKEILFNNFNIYKLLNKIYLNINSEQFRISEYPLLLLFCISGTVFLISSSDIISIFLAIELQSYSLYLISSIYRNS